GEFIDVPLRNYSSGMTARLGFAIPTAWDPEILILDGGLAVGGAAFQQKCHRRLRGVLASGATVLMVSHVARMLMLEGSRCLWLSEGHLVADRPPAEVLAQYHPGGIPKPKPETEAEADPKAEVKPEPGLTPEPAVDG